MIKFEHTEVIGWEHAIRGMRNPMNSWEKSDSLVDIGQHGFYDVDTLNKVRTGYKINGEEMAACADWTGDVGIGSNDHDLMMRLRNAGTDHRKFMRMITVYVDITAPLYWWKEFDTYKVGTVANSCSTMHKIHAKEFTLKDFSHEHLFMQGRESLESTINDLNYWRNLYLNGGSIMKSAYSSSIEILPKDKTVWWQMIQLLPSSYNQKRTVMLNYEVLANMYNGRVWTPHKLDEWRVDFANWIEELPYSEIITGFADKDHEKLVKDIGKIKEAVEKLVDPTKKASEASRAIRDLIDKLNEKE